MARRPYIGVAGNNQIVVAVQLVDVVGDRLIASVRGGREIDQVADLAGDDIGLSDAAQAPDAAQAANAAPAPDATQSPSRIRLGDWVASGAWRRWPLGWHRAPARHRSDRCRHQRDRQVWSISRPPRTLAMRRSPTTSTSCTATTIWLLPATRMHESASHSSSISASHPTMHRSTCPWRQPTPRAS